MYNGSVKKTAKSTKEAKFIAAKRHKKHKKE